MPMPSRMNLVGLLRRQFHDRMGTNWMNPNASRIADNTIKVGAILREVHYLLSVFDTESQLNL